MCVDVDTACSRGEYSSARQCFSLGFKNGDITQIHTGLHSIQAPVFNKPKARLRLKYQTSGRCGQELSSFRGSFKP